MIRSLPVRLFIFGILVFAIGCSGEAKLAKVKGTVTLDNQPLAKGTIVFEAPGQRPASARIENGQIVGATTFQPDDGVPVGSHKVGISATAEGGSAVVANPGDSKGPASGDYMGGKSLVPTKYNNPANSQLTAEIKSGENTLKFELSSK